MFPLVVTLVLFARSCNCNGLWATTCAVVPRDQYVRFGSDTEAWCRSSCVPGGVFWTLNGNAVDGGWWRAANATHSVLTLRNVTHREATLQCHSVRTQQILGGTIIRTYRKPDKISCKLEYREEGDMGVPELFDCAWEHQVASANTTYTLLYANLLSGASEICRSRVKRCQSVDAVSVRVNGSVAVRAETPHWKVESDPFHFDPHRIMKLNRPRVEVTACPDHLLVTWGCSVPYRRCLCQVRYLRADADGTLEPKVINKTLEHQEEGSETLREVESCTSYNVSVRCALEGAPWSNWSRVATVRTQLNEKQVKLRLWRKISEPAENGTRTVRAMWRELPASCPGSFTYTVTRSRYHRDGAGAQDTDVPCGSATCDVDVDGNANRIRLRAWDDGRLIAEESVYVPATGESLPQVGDIQTSRRGGVVVVSWTPPARPVSGYVIDWTRSGSGYEWMESERASAALPDLVDKKPYDLTITPLFGNKTGHGAQVLHVCSRVGGPGSVTNVTVKPNYRTAFVGWNTRSQEECSGAALSYSVFYSTETGPTLNVTVDGAQQNINLKDLDPDTQYSVFITATAPAGSSTSSRRLFRTGRHDPRLPLALGVSGSILILLVFSVGLFCAFQWKKLSEKPIPNPGLSSLELWSSAGRHKGTGFFQPFSDPTESHFDHIYTEDPQPTSTSLLKTSSNNNAAKEATEEDSDPTAALAADVQDQKPRELLLGSPGESTALLSSENGPFSPYRSQSSVETPAPMAPSQCRRVPGEKTAPVTIYVTLDVYDEGQSR